MESSQIDAVEFRDKQRESWNTAASGWRKRSEMLNRTLAGINDRLVELAGIESGGRVLDVAAGYGEPSLTAARAVGSDGRVVATDISAEMLAYGRERAADAGLDNVEFIEADASSLDFPAGSFDAALSRFGIIFEPDGEGAAARVRGFLEPGGRMAIASWGTPDQVPFLSIPMGTAMRRLEVPPPPPGTPGPLSRPTPDALAGLLEGGGFSDVEAETTEITFALDSPEDFTSFIQDIAQPIRAMIAPHPQEVQDQTWDAITEAVREHAGGDGPVNLTNTVLLAVGRA